MTGNIFGYLLQDRKIDLDKKAFLGIGFGPEGVPIDIVPLHLLGGLLPDFSLLVVDEFAKFNSHDGSQEVRRLEDSLDRLDTVYGKTSRIRCSEFMDSTDYQRILRELGRVIEGSVELRNIAFKTVPSRYRRQTNALDYAINEAACIAYLYTKKFRLKLGPERERQYDKLLKVLNTNGKYGFRGTFQDMEFGYTLPAFSLSGSPVIPYIPNKPSDRIFLDDTEQEVANKLSDAHERALKYFSVVGHTASHVLGINGYDTTETSDRSRLLEISKNGLIQGVIRPYSKVAL